MKKTITLNQISEFKKYLLNEEKSSVTVEKYIRDVTTFYVWSNNRAIEKSDVIAYKEFLMGTYKIASVNSMLSSINSFFTYLEWFELKVKTLKKQKELFIREEKELTKAEYERLLDAARSKKNKRIYYIMQTICATGIRISELRFITTEAIRMQRAEVRCKGKNRVVFIPKNLCKILKEYAKEENIQNGSIFTTKTGKPINRRNVWADMKKLCETANVARTKVFPHNLRHLFARTFYSQQKDIVRLADLLGHSSVNTTRIYTIESGNKHKRIIQRLGLVHMRA